MHVTRRALVGGMLVVLLLGGLMAAGTAAPIRLKTGTLDPATGQEPSGGLSTQSVQPTPTQGHVLVQFRGSPNRSLRSRLGDHGMQILDYVPEGTWYAALDDPDMAAIRQMAPINGIIPVRAAQKIDPSFRRALGDDSSRPASVTFFSDVNATEATAIASRYGTITAGHDVVHTITINASDARIQDLAHEDAVKWITYPHPEPETHNEDVRKMLGADVINDAPFYYEGYGLTAAIIEGHVSPNHDDLNWTYGDKLTIVDPSDLTGYSDHATHVAGTLGGAGQLDPTYTGVAPGVELLSYSYHDGSSGLKSDYDDIVSRDAVVATNSWGWASGENCQNENIFGRYGGYTALYDGIISGDSAAVNGRLSITFSAGNDRDEDKCDNRLYNTTTAPGATAKNTITVGALTDRGTMSSFSSWGPTNDGRIKPTITTNGVGVTSTLPGNEYGSKSGTSMSTPAIAGSIVLLQDAYDQVLGTTARPSTIKALLIHTAEDLRSPGPDYETGWGNANISRAVRYIEREDSTEYDQIRTGTLSSDGENDQYTVTFSGDEEVARFTLVWSDHPGTQTASKQLVNDLDMVVTNPSGTRRYQWSLDPDNPADNATKGTDHRNPVEMVEVQDPEAGEWDVTIDESALPQAPQDYALIINSADTSPPELFVGVPQNQTYASGSLELSLLTNEDVQSVEYSINGGTNLSMTNDFGDHYEADRTFVGNGSYRFDVYATDLAGNTAHLRRWFTIDTVRPRVNTTINDTSVTMDSHTVRLNASMEDNIGLNEAALYTNTTGTFEQILSPIDTSPLTCSSYWGADCALTDQEADNTVDTCQTREYNSFNDASVHEIYLDQSAYRTGQQANITVTFYPDTANNEYIWVRQNAGDWTELYYDGDNLPEGPHNVTVQYTPTAAGNMTVRGSVNWFEADGNCAKDSYSDNDDVAVPIDAPGQQLAGQTAEAGWNWTLDQPETDRWWMLNVTDAVNTRTLTGQISWPDDDTSPPTITSIEHPANTSYDDRITANATFSDQSGISSAVLYWQYNTSGSFTGSDGASSMSPLTANADDRIQSTWTATVPPINRTGEGSQIGLLVSATDADNDTSSDDTEDVLSTARFVDIRSSPPRITLTGPRNTTYTTATPALNLTLSEPADINQTIDAGEDTILCTACSAIDQRLTALDDGQHSLTIEATDWAGNTNTTGISFHVDTTAPTPQLAAPANDSRVRPGTLIEATSPATDLAGLVLTNASGDYPLAAPYTTSTASWSRGEQWITINATDQAGNSMERSYRLHIDDTSPDITFAGPAVGNYSNTSIHVNLTASEPLARLNLSHGGTVQTLCQDCSNATTTISPDPGILELVADATDQAGNTGNASRTLRIDRTAPLTIHSPEGNSSDRQVWFNVSTDRYLAWANVTVGGREHRLDPYNATNASARIRLVEGRHTPSFELADTADNTNSSTTTFWVTIPPTITDTDLPRRIARGTHPTARATIQETNVTSVELSVGLPNGTIVSTGMAQDGSDHTTPIGPTEDIGRYSWNITVNDSLGLQDRDSGSFTVTRAASFSPSSRNRTGPANLTWTISDPVTQDVTFSATNTSVNTTLAAGNWTLRLQEDNTTAEMQELNLTDGLTGTVSWDPNASLENVSADPYHELHRVAAVDIDPVFRHGSLTFDFNRSRIDNIATVVRCRDWNLSTTECSGSWSNVTQNASITADTVSVNTTSFSAFSIGESCQQQCGDWDACSDGSQARSCTRTDCTSYQETRSCSTDTADDGGGGGGGGGFGGLPDPEPSFPGYEQEIYSIGANSYQSFDIDHANSSVVHTVNISVSSRQTDIRLRSRDAPETGLPDPPGTRYHTINLSLTGIEASALSGARIGFDVEQDWLQQQDVSAEQIRLYRYTGDWTPLETTINSRHDAMISYQARTPGFSIFAVAAAPPAPTETGPDDGTTTNGTEGDSGDPICGDGICSPAESPASCSQDCGNTTATDPGGTDDSTDPDDMPWTALGAIIVILIAAAGFLLWRYHDRGTGTEEVHQELAELENRVRHRLEQGELSKDQRAAVLRQLTQAERAMDQGDTEQAAALIDTIGDELGYDQTSDGPGLPDRFDRS